MSAVVEFESVSKTYKSGPFGAHRIAAVRDVSFRVEPGEVFGLLGPNRAGKTTLVKMLLSLCRPTEGRVLRFGKPLSDRAPLARIGYVHENQAFPRYLTASTLLEYYGCLTFLPEPDVRRRVPELLAWAGLTDRAAEPIARFSKGMSQRLALAQALVNDPELLVLDEPMEGLDLEGRKLVHALAAEQRRRGRSVLLVTHSLADAEQLCDRVGVIVGGRLVHLGPLSNLTQAPRGTDPRRLELALQLLYEKHSR